MTNPFPRDLVTRVDGRAVRRPDAHALHRIMVVARELNRLAMELHAIGIEAPAIEARYIALSVRHRQELPYIDAKQVSSIGYQQLAYVQFQCPALTLRYHQGVFYVTFRSVDP